MFFVCSDVVELEAASNHIRIVIVFLQVHRHYDVVGISASHIQYIYTSVITIMMTSAIHNVVQVIFDSDVTSHHDCDE